MDETSAQSRLDSLLQRLNGGKAATIFLVFLMGYFAFANVRIAARKYFWYDEVLTVAVAQQNTPSGIWDALARGVDGQPPTFYLVETLGSRLSNDPQVAYRIPSILAFLAVPLAMFWFLRSRVGNLAALTAAILPLLTPLNSIYATEARPYALMSACIALALVAWQRADRTIGLFSLALLLAAAECFHYYAVFAMIPFGIAEAFRYWRIRKLRLGVWAALCCGVIPLMVYWPIVARMRQLYGQFFWNKAQLSEILYFYDELLGVRKTAGGVGFWGAGIAVALGIGILASLISARRKSRESDAGRTLFPEELVLLLGLLIFPVIELAATFLSHGVFSARYAEPALLGVALASGFLIYSAGRRPAAWFLFLSVSILGFQEGNSWKDTRGFRKAAAAPPGSLVQLDAMVTKGGIRDLPVVVCSGLAYLPMAYYASMRPSLPFLNLIDIPAAIQYAHSTSVDSAMALVTAYLPLNVQQYSRFALQHRRFLLYSDSGNQWNWWVERLSHDGDSLKPLVVSGGATLYLVEAPESGHDASGKQ